MKTTRRQFLRGCSAAIAAMSGAKMHSVAFGNPNEEPNQNILITVFLRGGVDVLNLLPPIGGEDRAHYETGRSQIYVPVASALPLGTEPFGMNPGMATLHDLYNDGKVAIVQATGLTENTRSHFEAMAYMEYGTPGERSTGSGWITRHLASTPDLTAGLTLPALAIGNSLPQSFANSASAIALNNPDDFDFWAGFSNWRDDVQSALRGLYNDGDSALFTSARRTLDVAGTIREVGDYTPAAGVSYPPHPYGGTSLGDHMQTIAQMVKLELGLRAVTVDFGGWDTHENQHWYQDEGGSGGGGYFYDQTKMLSDSLSAFYSDLSAANQTDRVTILVMSEFGRRLNENADLGTDHGHGGAMLLIGDNVNGGLHGTWPGLHPDQLYDNADLEVTTDYRQVISEVLIRQFGNPNLGQVFPNYADYTPLNVVQGEDLTPIYDVDTPLRVGMGRQLARPKSRHAGLTLGAAGLAATAGLVALRERTQ